MTRFVIQRLFRALLDPADDERDFVRGQRLDARAVGDGRHPAIVVLHLVGDGLDEHALFRVAGHDDLALLGALEDAFERVHVQLGLGLVAAVALHARRVKNRLDVRGVGDDFFGGCGGQFGFLRRREVDGRKGCSHSNEYGWFHNCSKTVCG